MHLWFKYLFELRMNTKGFVNCYECGRPMHESVFKELTTCYSHILEKAKYEQFAGDPENVVIVHPDCHTLYTLKPEQAKRQYALLLKLREKHDILNT